MHIPDYFQGANLSEDVLSLAVLWRDLPIRFRRFRDEHGNSQGWAWEYDQIWANKNIENFEAFMKIQDHSKAVWDWLSEHKSHVIDGQNFLFLLG